MTPDTSGPGSLTPFAFYDRDSSCWRTSQATFLSDSTPCSVTLPKRGSMRDGRLYALPMSEPATDELGSSLLPTPAVNDMGEGKTVEAWDEWTEAMRAKHGNGNGHGRSLAIEAARLLPTPRAERTVPDSHGVTPAQLLPTPKMADGERGGDAERWKGTKSLAGRRSNLVDAAMHFIPTPTSLTDVTARGVRPGAPTGRPSNGTNEHLDDPRLPRLFSDAATEAS